MIPFQRDALQHFVEDGEKSPPPVFVGRQAILKQALIKAKRTGERKRGIPGNTTVITGAPGAGKSSVLGELGLRAAQTAGARVIPIANTDLEQNIPGVLRAIAVAGSSEPTQWLNFRGRLGWDGIRDLLKTDRSTPTAANLSELEHNQPGVAFATPVIVAIDEVQRFAPGTTSPPAQFLQQIHDASTGLPLTLVLAGLGDTPSVIRSMGLTRGLPRHTLGCFTPDEQAELMERWCAHFGITIGGQRGRMDQLMVPTDGWPRHVHCAQQATAEALLTPGVDGHADRIPDWREIQARSDQLRSLYYETQFSDTMKLSRQLTAHIVKTVAGGQKEWKTIQYDDILNVADKYTKNDIPFGWRLPEGETPQSYVTHLIHCGALEENPETGALACPIPSFQSYILRRGGGEPTLKTDSPAVKTEGDDPYTPPEPKPPGYEDDDPFNLS
ncbi:MAG: ATP-binding protein [Rhodobacteraceae bacterium]|nr:ATP-binding protein [Paracoccaceae bacterium]MCY4195541.1 ATP-binding protein [Paracoccaceae bacterium]